MEQNSQLNTITNGILELIKADELYTQRLDLVKKALVEQRRKLFDYLRPIIIKVVKKYNSSGGAEYKISDDLLIHASVRNKTISLTIKPEKQGRNDQTEFSCEYLTALVHEFTPLLNGELAQENIPFLFIGFSAPEAQPPK